MTEIHHIPGGTAVRIAKAVWIYQGYTPESRIERVLPSGSAQIIFNLKGKKFRYFQTANNKFPIEIDSPVITGVHMREVFLDASTRTSAAGAVLTEGAIPALAGIPASELRNRVIPLKERIGNCADEYSGKLREADSNYEKLHVLKSFLQAMSPKESAILPAVQYGISQIQLHNGLLPVSKIRRETGYSRRWFARQFRYVTGVTPKEFSRLCRFQYSLDKIRSRNYSGLTSIAHGCGYFDQSHFIHDFKKFSGITPSNYLQQQTVEKNHLPVL